MLFYICGNLITGLAFITTHTQKVVQHSTKDMYNRGLSTTVNANIGAPEGGVKCRDGPGREVCDAVVPRD